MAAWWNDLIKLWELPDVQQAVPSRPPGIHYAVKQALDRTRLVEDIGAVLDRGLLQNRAPAGFTVGHMRPGSVGLTFTQGERDTLYELGINPIVVKQGIPYVFGQRFHPTEGQAHDITGINGQLTPEFRQWILEPVKPDPVVIHIGKRQSGTRQLAERFKLRRYLQMTDEEILDNWGVAGKPQYPQPPIDPDYDPEDWGSVSQSIPLPRYTTTTTAAEVAQVRALASVAQPTAEVHPLHRALNARSQPIGLVTLDNR